MPPTDHENEKMEKEIELEIRDKEDKILKKRKAKIAEKAELYNVKENFYLAPMKNYMRYKNKRLEYKQLYHQSKFKYYATINSKLISKIIRKELFSKLVYQVGLTISLYLLFKMTKPGKFLSEFFESKWEMIKGFFKS